jgi:hypothetical protein
MRNGEFGHDRDELPWWRRERMKDLVAGIVLGFLSAGVVRWNCKKLAV